MKTALSPWSAGLIALAFIFSTASLSWNENQAVIHPNESQIFEDQTPQVANCSVSGFEGMPVALNASCALGLSPENASHRWDLDSDNIWDTPWMDTEEYEHIWGDDFLGQVMVERAVPKEEIDIGLEGEVREVGALNPMQWVAQTFVPNKPVLTKVAVSVSINWGEPSDLHVWIRETLEPSGTNLSHGKIPFTDVPRDRYAKPDEWPIIDVDDVVLQLNRTYYIMLNLFLPTNGSYESHGVGLLVPEWPTYGGNFTRGWTTDDDDNLGFRTYTEEVTPVAQGDIDVNIQNENPTISDIAFLVEDVEVSALFRIAGEKWHNVEIYLFESDNEIGYADITRHPGSPNDQTVRFANISTDPSKKYSATAYYTPEDDPINGEVWGATPAWFILESDNVTSRIHHTFNVRHEETWVWHIENLSQYLPVAVTFNATAHDAGSDDLTFIWDWGDGTTSTSVYLNNGVSPDPYPSPDIHPMEVTDEKKHIFVVIGAQTVTLTVLDDDGGTALSIINLTL